MLEQIKEAKDRKFNDIEQIKGSSLVTIMYGAGSYALDVTHFLEKQGINIEAYCIDESFLKGKTRTIVGRPVQPIELMLNKYPECNVIIGFADYVKARARLESLGVAERVYFIDAPNQYGFFDRSYIVKNADAFQATYDMLEDQKSREIFVDFINAKISGDPSGLYKHADFNQYFSDPVTLTDHETFVDSGAYDGDTIASLLENTKGKYRRIYAFEPDPENFKKLQQYINEKDLKHIVLTNAGCWSSSTTLNFSSDANMATIEESDADIKIEVVPIDNVVEDEKVTYIKMDIEGAELEALKGAKETIRRNRPKLAICAYHKPEDLITLPQYIRGLSNNYKLYLRHHQYMSWEMVLYAIPT